MASSRLDAVLDSERAIGTVDARVYDRMVFEMPRSKSTGSKSTDSLSLSPSQRSYELIAGGCDLDTRALGHALLFPSTATSS